MSTITSAPAPATSTIPSSTADHLEASAIELFRAGTQTDASGNKKAWTIADLDEMASTYNAGVGNHDAPILVGHDGDTSYGWLSRVYRDGEVLKGDYTEVPDEFAGAVNEGRYKKRSISIYPRDYAHNPTPGKLNIRHLAYVGVPAVKGLKDHKFADGDDGAEVYEFGDGMFYGSPFQTIGQIMQGMRDRLIEESGLETANQQFPIELIQSLLSQTGSPVTWNDLWDRINPFEDRLSRLERSLVFSQDPNATDVRAVMSSYSEGELPVTETRTQEQTQEQAPDMTAEFAEMRSNLAALTAQNEALTAQNNAQAQRLQTIEAERERDRVTNFVEGLVRDRKLHSDKAAEKIELALQMPVTSFEYSEGGETKTGTLRDRYLADLASANPIVSVGDMRTRPGDAPTQFAEASRRGTGESANFSEASMNDDAKIRSHMAQHSCSYSEAFNALVAAGGFS